MTNFGDDLNTSLVSEISGQQAIGVNQFFKNPSNEVIYMVIGSVLQWADRNSIVWGTGYMSPNSRMKEKPLKICTVRGKLTRRQLLKQGFECPEVYGDPALLYSQYYKPSNRRRFKLGILPHYVDQDASVLRRFRTPEVLFINARDPVNKVVDDINSCERIAASCLHGLIIADAYGIPSLWIKMSDKVLGRGFKFKDYFSSVGRKDNEPMTLDGATTVESMLEGFAEYKINIDLDKLYEACPFKRPA